VADGNEHRTVDSAHERRADHAGGEALAGRRAGGAREVPSARQIDGGGTSLAAHAPELPRDVASDLRIHTSAEASRASRLLGAHAFSVGRDLFFSKASDARADSPVLAHEVGHAVQGGTELETLPSPDVEIPPFLIASMTDAELTELEGTAETLYSTTSSKQAPVIWANVAAIHREMRKRGLPIKLLAAAQTTTIAGDQGSAAEVASLQMMIDVLLQELALKFGDPASTNLVAWLKNERTVIANIAQSAVLHEGDLLEDMMKGLEQVLLVRAAVPETASADSATALAQRGVTQAIKDVLDELQTPLRGEALKGLLDKLDAFTDAYSATLVRALVDTRARVALAPSSPGDEEPTPAFKNDDAFINGFQWDGKIYFGALWDQLATFQHEKQDWLDDVTKLAAPAATDPVEKRLAFMKDHEAGLDKTLKRGGTIVLLGAALAIGRSYMAVMTEATDLVVWQDVANAQIVRDVAVKLAKALEAGNFDELDSLQRRLNSAVGAMHDRFENAKDYLSKVDTMMKISVILASLFTGGQASAMAMGTEATAFGTSALTTGTLLRGALAFSLVSQATTIAMTGKVPSLGEMALQTGMDVVTMGMMHAVNLRLGGIYGSAAAVPVGVKVTAEFTTMWAWSTSVGFAMQALDPKAKKQSLAGLALDSVKHTLIGFAAMGVVHKASELPTFDASAPDPVLAAKRAAAVARYDQLRFEGKALDAEYQKIMDAEDSKGLEDIVKRVEKWYGAIDGSLAELAEAGLWDEAGAKALSAELKTDVASIRNARDAVRLGLRATSGRTIAYSGEVRNAEMFLRRLKATGGIKDYAPIERGGMYRVTQADGTTAIWYPEGGATEAGRGVDFASQYLLDAHPELPPESAAHVMEALNSAPGADIGKLIDRIASPSGQKVLTWLSHPETAAALKASARGGELVGFVLANDSLQALLETSGKDLVTWNDMPFEEIYGGRDGDKLDRLVRDVMSYRGSLAGDLATVKTVFAELRNTKPADSFSAQAPMGIYDPANPPALGAQDYMRQYLQQNKLQGELSMVELGTGTWFLRTQDGKLVDGFFFAKGATVPTVVDIASAVTTLEAAKAELAADPTQKEAIAKRVAPALKQLEFLRGVRGIDDAHINELLDAFESRPATAPVEVKPADPAPAPPPEIVPVTTKKVRSKARDEILGQASRMGLLDAKTVPAELTALEKWNPGDPTTAPPDVEAALAAARTLLASELARGVKAAKEYYGAGNTKKIRAEFATEAQADEALRLAFGKHERTMEMMHGMALTTRPVPGEIASAIPLEKIFSNAPTARDARLAFEVYGRLRDAGIPGADRLMRDMAKTPSAFRGGMYTLRAIANDTIKIEDVESLEVKESTNYEVDGEVEEVVRHHDVVLKDKTTIEMKAWTRFLADKVAYQFGKDAVLRTRKFTAPEGLKDARWIFEKLPIVTEGDPPRTRTMTEAEARKAILEAMEKGVRDWGARMNLDDADIRNVIKALRGNASTIINISRFE